MKTREITYTVILFLFVVLLLAGCKKDEDNKTTLPDDLVQVNISFNHRVGSYDLQFDTLQYENAFGNILNGVTFIGP